jgi:hypothetical protein
MNTKLTWLLRAALIALVCASPASRADTTPANQPFTLTWTAPGQNEDGTPLTDLIGYYIYVGSSPEALLPLWFVGADQSSLLLSYGATGDYFFAVSAVNAEGIESDPSEAIIETVE